MSTDQRVRDAGIAAALLVGGLFIALLVPDARVTWSQHAVDVARWPDLVALGVACLGETQRRARPVLGLALATAALLAGPLLIGATSVGGLIVFGDLLYCAVLYASQRVSWIVAGTAAAVLASVGVAGLVTGGPGSAVRAVLNLAALLGIPVAWALEVRHHRELAASERERADQAQRMAELDRSAAVAAERARMARDLHDVIAGQLSAIAIQSEAALTVPGADPATLRRVLTAVRRDSVASLAEMRTMIGLLRADGSADAEPRTAPAGLADLGTLLDAGRASGLRIEVDDTRPGDASAPAAVELAAYRIVQESLTNAAKHAPGSTVRLVLGQHDGELRVDVRNDLVAGAPRGGGTGNGLLGLRERASAVGGGIEAGPSGRTWHVRAVLPVGQHAPVGR